MLKKVETDDSMKEKAPWEGEEARSILALVDGVDFISVGRVAMLDKITYKVRRE